MHRLPRAAGEGNGPSFVAQDVFNDVVFGGDPSEQDGSARGIRRRRRRKLWKKSLDDWGDPLRPAT